MISVFFTRSKIGSTVAALLLLALLAPGFGLQQTSPKSTRIVTSLSTVVALYLTMAIVFEFETSGFGTTFENIRYEYDYYTVLIGIIMMLIDCIVYFLLGIYLTYVLPSTYGVKLPVCFCCSPKFYYSCLGCDRNDNDYNKLDESLINDVEKDQVNFESMENTDLQVGVSIQNLRKTFGNVVAVNGTSLNMYNGQIFALLGHNGAGKTTT